MELIPRCTDPIIELPAWGKQRWELAGAFPSSGLTFSTHSQASGLLQPPPVFFEGFRSLLAFCCKS